MQPIKDWIDDLGYSNYKLEVVSADASLRKYYRLILENGDSFVIMDSSLQKDSVYPFIDISVRLLKAVVDIPRVYHQDLAHGYLLLEDLGDTHLSSMLNDMSYKLLYTKSIYEIIKMQNADTTGLDSYDEEFILFEMSLMQEWYIEKYLGVKLNNKGEQLFNNSLQLIKDEMLSQPQGYFVHRDFHSRNIMFKGKGKVAVIDYQDARVGAITYDLASLLKDVYIRFDGEKIIELVLEFKELKGGLQDISDEQFIRWFDFTALQRHIKILGIFARLNIRDNKPNYIENIPMTISYIREAISIYSELKPLGMILDSLKNS